MRKKNTRGTRRRKLSQEQLERRELLAADLIEAVDLTTIEDDTVVAEVASLTAGGGGVNAPDLGSAGAETNPDHTTQATDVVLEWNELFNELLVADETNQNPGYASRAMAMLNLAIYDAVTIADGNPGDTFYDYDFGHGPRAPVIAEVAASQAAYSVLSSLYPDQQAMLDAFYAEVSAGYPGNAATAASVALGDEIAAVVIQARADDGWDAEVDYTYTDGAGNFQADPLNPDVPVWGPGWGEVETFSISSAENFAPETTPALTSEEYADSYNEVKELGSVDSTVRTADQTEAGIFWAYDREGLGTPLSLFNDVLQTVAVQQGNTLQENAALFAQASVAMADAAIVAWHTKFDEQFWRPVTAIHDGDNDGNELTEGD
ncbi:MAG: vanadium-dependent haloperoxidase, partial [Planctomycetota bacterium]